MIIEIQCLWKSYLHDVLEIYDTVVPVFIEYHRKGKNSRLRDFDV